MTRTLVAVLLCCLALQACGIDGEPETPPAKTSLP
jgi:predicted small lipoprotein YifL